MSIKIEVYIRVSKSEQYTSTDIALSRVETISEWEKIRRELDNAIEDATARASAQLTTEDRKRRELAEAEL